MNFAASLAGNFAGVVQYNKDNRAFEVCFLLTKNILKYTEKAYSSATLDTVRQTKLFLL